jgi:myo-inositol-1(or 4)-monophosphatase
MIDQLQNRLGLLIELLHELGLYQLDRQKHVRAQVKSDAVMEEAWKANDVFSEVDINTEKRLLAFCRQEFGNIPVISEEFNGDKVGGEKNEFTIVIDPLDGTKPYLEGKKGFGISFGVLHRDRFVFGINYYPALETLYYAFSDTEGIFNQDHKQISLPTTWKKECYLSLGFYDLLKEEYRSPDQFKAQTAITIGDYPRCATYIFKRILEGTSLAYLSQEVMIWDIGPSSLLLEKCGCRLVNLEGRKIDFKFLAQPPFQQPAVVILPKGETDSFLSKLDGILIK